MSNLTLQVLDALRHRVSTLLFISTIVVTAAGAVLVLRGGVQPSAGAATRPAAGARPGVEAELITVGPDGFEPSRLTRPKGRVYLVVDNMTDLPAIDLRLAREAGNSLHEVRIPRGQADWTGLLNLTPGTYVLREAAHPDWTCRLDVTP